MGVSRRELARILGVSEAGVRKALSQGKITALPDGTIDPEAAREAWAKNSDPARTKVRSARTVRTDPEQAAPLDEGTAREAVNLIKRVLMEEGGAESTGLDFDQARTAETILKARERDIRIAKLRKELVPLEAVRKHVNRAFTGYRQAVQGIPARFGAQMAAEVGCDVGLLDAALNKVIAMVLDELSSPVVRA
ncbi:conserved hypothetical protein [Hyphomicrobiales bacterium]|nr:conserved hypothetical protein [Hyphomicrobiales bacterium]CAH1669284.1 conserved hypothetical protein [Hyphomicrobiales bacterium]